MTLLVPNQGEGLLLDNVTTKQSAENLVLRLYTNDYTPVEGTVEADLTDASGSGYAEEVLTPASWTTTTGDPTESVYPQVTFAFTGALGNVYGYMLEQATSGKVVWAERFTNGPYNVQNNGDEIKVTPKITLE